MQAELDWRLATAAVGAKAAAAVGYLRMLMYALLALARDAPLELRPLLAPELLLQRMPARQAVPDGR